MIAASCIRCRSRLSRWGWFACDDEPVLYTVCIPCLCDDAIGFEAMVIVTRPDGFVEDGV